MLAIRYEEWIMTKKIRINEEVYNLLVSEKLPAENLNETIIRLIRRYEQTEFIKRQKQILEEEEFLSLDESE